MLSRVIFAPTKIRRYWSRPAYDRLSAQPAPGLIPHRPLKRERWSLWTRHVPCPPKKPYSNLVDVRPIIDRQAPAISSA